MCCWKSQTLEWSPGCHVPPCLERSLQYYHANQERPAGLWSFGPIKDECVWPLCPTSIATRSVSTLATTRRGRKQWPETLSALDIARPLSLHVAVIPPCIHTFPSTTTLTAPSATTSSTVPTATTSTRLTNKPTQHASLNDLLRRPLCPRRRS